MRVTLALCVAFGCALSSASHATEPVKASLRLKWVTQAQFAGFYLARDKGYYKDAGIDLTINPGGPNLLTENLVATDADTFGLSGGTDSVFAAREKGLPIVCIGIAHQKTPFAFVAKGDGPIQKFEDLKGHKISTWFTGAQYVLFAMMASKGLAQGDVNVVPQQVSVTPFINGEIDAVTATFYNELDTIKSRGATNLKLFVAEDYGVTFPRDTLITSEKMIRDNPKLVEGFVRASVKGWQDAFKDPKAAVDIVMKEAPTLERPHQEAMIAEVLRLMKEGQAAEKGLFYIDPAAVAYVHDFLLQNKVLQKPVDIAAAYDTRFLDAIPAADKKP